ncbi:MAG: T9SS type A sorting domain-containing protein [Flavobacteriaceae bacterium]
MWGGLFGTAQSSYTDGNTTYDLLYDQGTLNNGDVTVPLLFNTTQNDSPNVLGNPYASSIAADDFINANPQIDALYFWEHLTPPSPLLPGAYNMNFSMEDISMYNLMGGVAAASDLTGTVTKPNGYIASAQGFGVKPTAAGTATFTNAMRRLTNNDTWRQPELQKNRLWLQVAHTGYELQNTTLIGFVEGASPALDAGYDSKRLATVLSLYSLTENGEELGIQTREAFDPEMKISLGFSTLVDEETEYTLSLSQWEGTALEGVEIYLYDALLQTTTLLNDGAYVFRSDKGTYPQRFTLFFQAPQLEVPTQALAGIRWFPNPAQDQITVWNPNSLEVSRIVVYDLQGREVAVQKVGTTQMVIAVDLSVLQTGVYVVQIETLEGSVTERLMKQ